LFFGGYLRRRRNLDSSGHRFFIVKPPSEEELRSLAQLMFVIANCSCAGDNRPRPSLPGKNRKRQVSAGDDLRYLE
jgi:hypothetical protein